MSYAMNGNMIESSSMIPGSTNISPSPTMIQQQHPSDLYSNGGNNMMPSLRTHSSKFPVSIWSEQVTSFALGFLAKINFSVQFLSL